MLPSHEALDRPGGISRRGLTAPLRKNADFRALWFAMCISLIGDGICLVAIAWQVYELSDGPTALAVVGIAMTVPTIAFLLLGGVISDRRDRLQIMVYADQIRAIVMALIAALSLAGVLEVWHLVILIALYGAGTAFFAPAFDAFVADVLPPEDLGQANALDQFVRPLALRLAGPALGGFIIGWAGVGSAFALDAASFLVSCSLLLTVRTRQVVREPEPDRSVVSDLREGWRFVRDRPWLWATFASAAFAYLLFMGPVEVLLPFLVKEILDASAFDLGVVLAAGGVGSVFVAIVMGRLPLPKREIRFIYAAWTVGTLALAGYGIANSIWQLAIASFLFNGLETAGTIVWATAKQRHVPTHLLGRVSSLDWLISIGLLPLSFALTGPAVELFGTRATLIGAGVLGSIATAAAFLVPRVQQIGDQPCSAMPVISTQISAAAAVSPAPSAQRGTLVTSSSASVTSAAAVSASSTPTGSVA